jgi:hypothetical protein
MYKPSFDNSRADRRGMLIETLCFVHCVAGSVLLSLAGLASFVLWNPGLHELPQNPRQTRVRNTEQFFWKALQTPGHPRPRVISVDGNPSYPKVIAELKQSGNWGADAAAEPVRI